MDGRLDKIIVAILNIIKITILYLQECPYSLEIHTEDFRATMHTIYSQMV